MNPLPGSPDIGLDNGVHHKAAGGPGTTRAWDRYQQWLRWAWSGKVTDLLRALRAARQRAGPAPATASDEDPRRVLAAVVTYVEHNQERMQYPRYRQQGLPISSAPVESTIKQLNRRLKGSEKFWLAQGAEAILQVHTAYLSEDGRADRAWQRPRPYARAAGNGRLPRPAPAH